MSQIVHGERTPALRRHFVALTGLLQTQRSSHSIFVAESQIIVCQRVPVPRCPLVQLESASGVLSHSVTILEAYACVEFGKRLLLLGGLLEVGEGFHEIFTSPNPIEVAVAQVELRLLVAQLRRLLEVVERTPIHFTLEGAQSFLVEELGAQQHVLQFLRVQTLL